jgi:hypothetical protein
VYLHGKQGSRLHYRSQSRSGWWTVYLV